MYRLIILSAIIVGSFDKALPCNDTYDVANPAVKSHYNDSVNCRDKCDKAANSTINHIAYIILNNKAFEFKAFEFNYTRSAVSFNDRSANDMLYSYIFVL